MKGFKRSTSAVSLVILICIAFPASASDIAAIAARQSIQARHVPEMVANGAAAMTGRVDIQQRLKLAINLPLRNQSELTQLLHDIYDSQSPGFHHYLSVQEFTDRFGATQMDYDSVVTWANANGFTVTGTTLNRRLVSIEGAVSVVNRAFNVTMTNYRHPTEDRVFFAPDREPTIVGLNVPLLQITGMDNSVLPRTMLRYSSTVVTNLTGSGPSGEYLPSDMRAAYYGNGPLTGAGQSIGIFSFNGYLSSDVQLYYTTTGMSSSVPINNVLVDGYNGNCTNLGAPSGYTGCYDPEQILDIVNAIGMAPGITQIRFYEGSVGDDSGILNKMATENIAKVISSSWSWNPADAASDDPIFQEFAAQGQTYVNASGDCGDYAGNCAAPAGTTPNPAYFFPGVDPYILEVGGTDLTTTGPGGAWVAETGWPQSGGGFVSGTPIPSWQQLPGVINSSNGGSSTLRNSPDVAAEANFDNVTVNNGTFSTGGGGTSFAAPRWAGLLALVNQRSVANGKGTVGFINGTLYSINHSAAFHDIVSGSNPSTGGGNSGFNAVTGYDLVTGWGSPVGATLVNQLAGTGTNLAAALAPIINLLLQ